jgi:hypothetical protein
MSRDYDGIIRGSGHNRRILQAYRGRAGLRVPLSASRATGL